MSRADLLNVKLIEAKSDAPSYRKADSQSQHCHSCKFADTGNDCTKFDFKFDDGFVCDAWAAKKSDEAMDKESKEFEFVNHFWKKLFVMEGKMFGGLKDSEGVDITYMLELEPQADFVILKTIMVSEGKRRGGGTHVMGQLNKKADELGVVMKLDPVPWTKEIPKKALVSFYKKAGFEKDDGSVGRFKYDMVRYPKGFKK